MYGVGTSRSNFSAEKPRSATTCLRPLRVQLRREDLVRDALRVRAPVLGVADLTGRDLLGRLRAPARRPLDHQRVHRVQRLAGVAVGVHAHRVAELAAEQAVDRHAVVLADEIPERGLDARDRVVDDARRRPRARAAPAQLGPQAVDVARVLADQQRRQVAHDRGQAGCAEALADPRETLGLGVHAHEGPVVVRLDDGGVHSGDPHRGPSFQRARPWQPLAHGGDRRNYSEAGHAQGRHAADAGPADPVRDRLSGPRERDVRAGAIGGGPRLLRRGLRLRRRHLLHRLLPARGARATSRCTASARASGWRGSWSRGA